MASTSRECLTIDEKFRIISELQSEEPNQNFTKTAQKYGVSRSAISRLWKDREEFKGKHETFKDSNRKRKKAFMEEDVDSALSIWLEHKNNQHARLNAPLLKKKAEQLAEEMGHSFIPTDGWVQRFKERHDLRFKKEYGEKQSTDTEGADTWRKTVLPGILADYSPEDIYNADETGIYYKGLPDRGYVHKSTTLVGGKKQKERLTVLVTSNMSGTDKKKLLVIGKSMAPRGFPKDTTKLPVSYYSSANAWMTSAIFHDFLRKWDKVLRLQGRSILLLIDNCSAHPPISDLTSIRLEYLPPNTTATIQPMDQGIIRNLKCHYRSLLNDTIISELDADESCVASTVLKKVTVLRAIYFLFDAWNNVTQSTIKNCFKKGGFIFNGDEGVHVEAEAPFTIPENLSQEEFDQFCAIDENIPTVGELSDHEIVTTVLQNKQKTPDIDEEEDEPLQPPSKKELPQSLSTIRTFMELNGLTSQTSFGTVVTEVQRHIMSTKTQSSITDFFRMK